MQDQTLFDSLDILTKVLSRLDAGQVTQNSKTLEAMQKALWGLLEHPRAAIRKRAIASFASLVPLLSETAFESLVLKLQKEMGFSQKAKDMDRLATLVNVCSIIGYIHDFFYPIDETLLLKLDNEQTKRCNTTWTASQEYPPTPSRACQGRQ